RAGVFARDLDRAATAPPALGIATDVDDQRAVIAARTPQPILVVAAERRRQAVGPAVDGDGRRLPVMRDQDRGAALILRRQAVIDRRDFLLQLAPAELVRQALRQGRADAGRFDRRRL